MADDTIVKERVRRAADVPVPPRRLSDVVQRARWLRWRRAGAGSLVAAVVAAGFVASLSGLRGLGDRDAPREPGTGERVHAIGFLAAEGWVMAASPEADLEWQPTVWVANVPFAETDVRDAPREDGVLRLSQGPGATIERLPSNGILIEASIVAASDNALPPNVNFPLLELPLRLPPSAPETSWEGYTRGHSRHVILATVNGRYLDVRIRYGTDVPTEDMLAEAQAELDRLVVEPAAPPTEAIDRFGISLDVPADLAARLFAWAPGSPVLEVSTLPLDGPVGDPVLPNRRELGPSDSSILLAETIALDTGSPPIEPPIAIREQDRCDGCEVLDDGTTPPSDHALYHRTFRIGGRSFELYVEFGSPIPGPEAWRSVNAVLGRIRIADAGA
jgi:hypothetical protein